VIAGKLEAVRGCLKEEMRLDIISSNLANSAAVGFKKDRISFQSRLAQLTQDSEGIGGEKVSPTDSNLVRIETDFTQGDIRATGNKLDLAIGGKGFFKILTPEGTRYTRKGNFTLDTEGNLVTQRGDKVLGSAGPINLFGERIAVDDRGRISVDGAQVDQLDVVVFPESQTLIKAGGMLFRTDGEAEEEPIPLETSVRQGYLEYSNVNVADELVGMIHCLRAFESYQKSIQVLDRLDNKATNDVSRLR
jgi:flagellar basal-body rod protein FlgG